LSGGSFIKITGWETSREGFYLSGQAKNLLMRQVGVNKEEVVSKVFSPKGRHEGKERSDLKTIALSLHRFARRVHCAKF